MRGVRLIQALQEGAQAFNELRTVGLHRRSLGRRAPILLTNSISRRGLRFSARFKRSRSAGVLTPGNAAHRG